VTLTIHPSDTPAAWDDFARRTVGSTHCHAYRWRDVIERAFGHQCFWLQATAPGGDVRGVLPLVRVKSRLFGHYLVSLPFLNYGGPIGEPAAVRALTDEAVRLATSDRVKLLELRSRIELPIDLPASHRKITVVLDLPATTDLLMKSFPAKLRSQVRRPAKEGVTVRFGADQVGPFYQVFARHMRDLGTPVMPRRFFEEVAAAFGDDAWIACAYLGTEPIAGGVALVWNDEVEITWASALAQYNRTSANMGLYWAFMERAVAAGLARFNFGRCTPDSGTHRFKKQWGSRDEPLWWYQSTPSGAAAATPSPDEGAYAWGPRLWKRLPLPLANLIGPRIVRSIP
jgi:FemAB-related protein (PEP-CTERM system-associated)